MILRRRYYGQKYESLDIIRNNSFDKKIMLSDFEIGIEIISIEKNIIIYKIDIPEFLSVKPPDWRDMAYDHKEIKNLIQKTVIDNSQTFVFEPLTEETIKKVENKLILVLGDLKSVIDLIAVKCEVDKDYPNNIKIEITFEHKNGEHQKYVIDTKYN